MQSNVNNFDLNFKLWAPSRAFLLPLLLSVLDGVVRPLLDFVSSATGAVRLSLVCFSVIYLLFSLQRIGFLSVGSAL
jgi:hypothetical protein